MDYYCDPEKREAKEAVPGVHLRTFWGDNMLLSISELAADTEVPAHSHPHEQIVSIIAGEFELIVDGKAYGVSQGDTFIIPGGVEHGARTGSTPTRVLDIFSPVREDYKY